MILTTKQLDLLLQMVNASITIAVSSGIPISQDCCKDIDAIKEYLYKEINKKTGQN